MHPRRKPMKRIIRSPHSRARQVLPSTSSPNDRRPPIDTTVHPVNTIKTIVEKWTGLVV